MKGQDAGSRRLERLPQQRRDGGQSGVELFLRNPDVIDFHAIEPLAHAAQGVVAAIAHRVEDRPHLGDGRLGGGRRPGQLRSQVVGDAAQVEPGEHGNIHRTDAYDPLMAHYAELTSVATTLTELTQRVTAMADDATTAKDDAIASELYEAERALRAATRRLQKLATRT